MIAGLIYDIAFTFFKGNISFSQSRHEDHEQQIKDLQQKLSRNEDERSLLRERLNEVELEYREAIDDRASTLAMYEEQLQSLVQERNALVEQQQTRSVDRYAFSCMIVV